MKKNAKHAVAHEELMAFLDGQLDARRRSEIAAHLPGCPQCRSFLESLEWVEQRVDDAERAEAPQGYFDTFASRVSSRIARHQLDSAKPKRAWFLRWGWIPTAAAAVLVAVMVLSIDYQKEMRLGTQKLAQKAAPKPAPEAAADEKKQETTVSVVPMARPPSAAPAEAARDREIAPAPAPSPPAQPAAGTAAPSDELAEVPSGLAAAREEPALQPELAGKSAERSGKDANYAKASSRAAKEAATEAPSIAEAPAAPTPPAIDLALRRAAAARPQATAGLAKPEADKAKESRQPPLAKARPRTGPDSLSRRPGPAADMAPAEVAEVQAIVIYLPDHNDSIPPPEVRRALRIDLR